MASLRKRRGKWQARVIRKGHDPVARTFILRSDAEKWARETEVAIERGTFEKPAQTIVSDLIQRYRREVTPKKKSARTERLVLDAWCREAICSKSAGAVRPADIARWRDARLAAGAATGTVRNAMAALSVVYSHAASEWGYDRLPNPIRSIKWPAPAKARTRRVSAEEIEAVKTHTESPFLPYIIDLAVETGMRQGEITRLVWRNIDLTKRTAHLPDTKNGEARTLPLTSKAVEVLTAYKHLTFSEARPDDDIVFPSTAHAVAVAFRRAVKRGRLVYERQCKKEHRRPDADYLTNLRFHDLRHEAVSRLFERGLNMMEVAAVSGHKTLQMLKRYTHLKAEALIAKLG